MSKTIQLARREVEAWKDSQDEALGRADLESLVTFGLNILEFIRRIDQQWCADVAEGKAPADPATMKCIGEMYAMWLEPTDALARDLSRLPQANDPGHVARRFWEAVAEIKAILSLDTERLDRAPSATFSTEAARARIQNRA